jgi:hypothetical protein
MITPDIAGLCKRLDILHEWQDSPRHRETITLSKAALERQAAEIERLRGALEPFVKLADAFDGDAVEYPAPDSASLGFDYARNKTMFTVADLRKARAALTGEDRAGSPTSQNTKPGLPFSDAGEP